MFGEYSTDDLILYALVPMLLEVSGAILGNMDVLFLLLSLNRCFKTIKSST